MALRCSCGKTLLLLISLLGSGAPPVLGDGAPLTLNTVSTGGAHSYAEDEKLYDAPAARAPLHLRGSNGVDDPRDLASPISVPSDVTTKKTKCNSMHLRGNLCGHTMKDYTDSVTTAIKSMSPASGDEAIPIQSWWTESSRSHDFDASAAYHCTTAGEAAAHDASPYLWCIHRDIHASSRRQ